jgi:hypothetical protein
MKYLFPKLDKHPNWKGGKVFNVGYPFLKADGHPRANNNGYVQEHILIAESSK